MKLKLISSDFPSIIMERFHQHNMNNARKASKFRHSVGKVQKREAWFSDLAPQPSPADSSNSLKASRHWIAYRHNSGVGNSIAVLDARKPGKIGKSPPLLNAHAGAVVDFDFSPFDDNLLMSGGEDGLVKAWRIPEEGVVEHTSNPSTTIQTGFQRRVESLLFHPSAENVLAAISGEHVRIFDLTQEKSLVTKAFGDNVLSVSWKEDGSLAACTTRDGQWWLYDPRQPDSAQGNKAHAANKTRCQFLGDKNSVLTTGFTTTRQKEYALWDCRKCETPLFRQQLESSSGVLMPFYDEDTGVVFLIGKGETSIRFFEINETQPFITDGIPAIVSAPIAGACLMPKRALSIMEAEIARIYCMATDAIIPVSFNVPRKSYTEFHEDIFPDTKSSDPFMTAAEWMDGKNGCVRKISLRPSLMNSSSSSSIMSTINDVSRNKVPPADGPQLTSIPENAEITSIGTPSRTRASSSVPFMQSSKSQDSQMSGLNVGEERRSRATSMSIRSSSFRYISGKPMHPRENFEDIKSLNHGLSGESDILETNREFLAFPISGPGGRIAVAKVGSPGRFPNIIPSFIAGSEVCDFSISKLDPNILAVGCEDAKIHVFRIPDEGLSADCEKPLFSLSGHLNRLNHVSFHPFVSNVILSSSPEQHGMGSQMPTIKLWDLEKQTEMRQLEGFQEIVLGHSWCMDGHSTIVTACRDREIRVFDARSSKQVLQTTGHEGLRYCRLAWIDATHFISVGTGKSSTRELNLYDIKNITKPLAQMTFNVSPSVVIPHFDEDNNVLYLCGKGDTSIQPVEVLPHNQQPLFMLSRYESPSAAPMQGVSFMPKRVLNVREMEVSRCWVLTPNHIEPVSFTVPRTRREYFHDDIFPMSRDLEHATMSSSEWFSGVDERVPEKSVDLKPSDMTKLSNAPPEAKAAPKYTMNSGARRMTDSERQEKFLNEVFQNAKEDVAKPLPQDAMEGVNPDEWDD